MTTSNQGGPGLGLQVPQTLYPANLLPNAPYVPGSSQITLAAGQTLPIPPGNWLVQVGKYTMIQYLDPVMDIWWRYTTVPGAPTFIGSDGTNFRVANLTGCPIGAVVTNAGSGYTAGNVTVTASAGGSTWTALVGGMVSTTTTITTAGSGYTIAPLAIFPAPPNGGVPATGYCTIASGTVSALTVVNQGAGYLTVPTPAIVPCPSDPNLGSIVNAVAKVTLTGTGSISAVLCTNSGTAQTSATAPTLTIAGAGGSSAAATAVMLSTATTASVTSGGAGYSATNQNLLTTIGGLTSATAVNTQPAIETAILTPRPALMSLAGGATITSVTTVIDGGLFSGTPTALVQTTALITTAATIVPTLGFTTDQVVLQPI